MISELMLKIESDEYERECDATFIVVEDKTIIKCITGILSGSSGEVANFWTERGYDNDTNMNLCPDCRGIGTRKVKLVGMVGIHYSAEHHGINSPYFYTERLEELAAHVTQAYRDDTLPDSIRDCLKEVSV